MTSYPTEHDWLIEFIGLDTDHKLSRRQREALGYLLTTHNTIAWIAGEMCISKQTAKNHCHAVYEKLEVSGRLELMKIVVDKLLYYIRMK
jgi:DNA-binding CsgD family transcriptional regulator